MSKMPTASAEKRERLLASIAAMSEKELDELKKDKTAMRGMEVGDQLAVSEAWRRRKAELKPDLFRK
jgi:hypothetical protein